MQQTAQRLSRLTALREIDLALTSSVDLQTTLSVLLRQIKTQLGVDGVNVMLLDPYLQSLESAKASGG